MKCNDCGQPFETKRLQRADVCDPCMENRGWLVANARGLCQTTAFRDIQRSMAAGRGTAKKKIEALKMRSQSQEME